MAFSNPVVTPSSGETLVNGLLWDRHWDDGGAGKSTKLAVYIAGTNGKESFDFGGDLVNGKTSAAEADAFRTAMALFESVSNIDFVEVNSKAEADIIVAAASSATVGGLGVAVPPGEDVGPASQQQGAALVSYGDYASMDGSSLLPGGYDFVSFTHELGHAVGLKHPHDRGGGTFGRFPGVSTPQGDYGDFNLNQGIYTMMSYNDGFPTGPEGNRAPEDNPGFGWAGTPMALDIAALQFLYGANTNYRAGNDTYTLGAANTGGTYYSAIWDAGGIDTISAGGDINSVIDLRPATIQVGEGGGGFVSSHKGVIGGFTIARGAVIENATGAGGSDQLIGNDAGNELHGGAGRDKLLGGQGLDRLFGDAGRDKLEGGLGGDELSGGANRDFFIFNAIAESHLGATDLLLDFQDGLDLIDLRKIDAIAASANIDNAFSFVGNKALSGAAGELRSAVDALNGRTVVEGDVNGGGADFRLRIDGQFTLAETDFLL